MFAFVVLPAQLLLLASGPALLPFVDDGGALAVRVQKAFVQAAKEARTTGYQSPNKVLGIDLRPTVANCKGDLICLTQIGSSLGVSQIIFTTVKAGRGGVVAKSTLIAVADASVIRSVDVALGEDAKNAVHAYKDAVFTLFGITRPGDIEIADMPADAIVSIDGEVQPTTKRFNVKPGYHALKVQAPDYDTLAREVFVRSGDVATVRFAGRSTQAELGPPLAAPPAKSEEPALPPLAPIVRNEPKLEPIVRGDAEARARRRSEKAAEKAEKAAERAAEKNADRAEKVAEKSDKAKSDKVADKSPDKSADKGEARPADKSPAEVASPSPQLAGSPGAPSAPGAAPAASATPQIVRITKLPTESHVTELVAAPTHADTQKRVEVATVERSPYRLPWIIAAAVTGGALVAGSVCSGLYTSSADQARKEPVQLQAQRDLNDAELRGNVANGFWIATGVLGAASVALIVLDFTYRPKDAPAQKRMSVGVGASGMQLSGQF